MRKCKGRKRDGRERKKRNEVGCKGNKEAKKKKAKVKSM